MLYFFTGVLSTENIGKNYSSYRVLLLMFPNSKNANILPLLKTEEHPNVDVSKSVIHKDKRVKEFMVKYAEMCFRYFS